MLVFCGLDCSGKSAIIDKLYDLNIFSYNEILMYHPPEEWRQNREMMAAVFNGESETMSSQDEVIFTRDLRLNIQKTLVEQLRQGKNIVFHRYIFSLFTYYAGIQTLDMNWIRDQNKTLLCPDEVIYCRIDEEEFRKRSINKPTLPFQQVQGCISRMIEYYDYLAKEFNWKIVNTSSLSIDQTLEKCIGIIKKIDTTLPMRRLDGSIVNI